MARDRLVRRLARRWHQFWAGSRRRARAYAWALTGLRSLLPDEAARHLASNMQSVEWPELDLPALVVQMGRETTIRVHPHFGEFDIEALARRRLSYEAELFAWLEPRVADYDVILEVGANVGIFTVFFSERLRHAGRSDAVVYAFEPSREAFRRLLANLRANHASNVHAVNAAIGDTVGFREFHEPEGHLTNGSFHADFAGRFSPRVRLSHVPCVTGTEVQTLVPPGARVLLKIDVEGAEAMVLDTLAPLIAASGADLLVEVLPGFERAILESRALRSGEFGFYEITDGGAIRRATLQAGDHRDWWIRREAQAAPVRAALA